MNFIEFIGYAASALVALSFTMKEMVRLRIINCVGCLLFVGYGAMIESWPVMLTNGFITGVNIYWLLKDKSRNKGHKQMQPAKAD
ncbi:YgjV family protein [Vibrio aerogenes]|nr:YgjV family protein [Vibrio aerogenes]